MKNSISFLGPENSFTHLALKPTLKELRASELVCDSVAEALEKVITGEARWAFLPVETNLRGVVRPHYDAFLKSGQVIRKEVVYLAKLALAARPDTSTIQMVASHPHAIEECSDWLDANLSDVERVDAGSSSGGAAMAAQRFGVAAICSAEAAKIHGLEIINSDISNPPGDVTRFYLVGKPILHLKPGNKSTIVVLIGAGPADGLKKFLRALTSMALEVTRIDSQTRGRSLGEYRLVIDFLHQPDLVDAGQVLSKLNEYGMEGRILGTYPAASFTAATETV